jgi:RNA polymerase sigma factor (sigma-70 family)
MSSVPQDAQLVTAYAAEGSETAFRSLVARHVSLVYATALRQVGDRGLAEEITQNVFVALARKAGRLGRSETIAGWLHRAAILESKARLRAELRRHRREEVAAQIAAIEREGTSPFDTLVPLLDEGLLNLRQGDRLALVLRFLEERSLQDVGQALGLDEDAARKRVSRALDRLAEFFRQRGLVVPAAAGVAAVFTNATQAAPAALAGSAAGAGLAAGGAACGLNPALFHLMNLTKTQTAIACAVLCALPLAWQSRLRADLDRQQTALSAQLEGARREAAELEDQAARLQRATELARNEAMTAEARTAELTVQRQGRIPSPACHWDDKSALARIPKSMLEELPIWDLQAVSNRKGTISGTMRELLQMTGAEARQTQDALDRFLAGYTAAEAQSLRAAPPKDDELQGRPSDQVRVFDVSGMGGQYAQSSQALFDDLQSALGSDRAALFKAGLHNWMRFEDGQQFTTSSQVAFDGDYRIRFYQPLPRVSGRTWPTPHRKANGRNPRLTGRVGNPLRPTCGCAKTCSRSCRSRALTKMAR